MTKSHRLTFSRACLAGALVLATTAPLSSAAAAADQSATSTCTDSLTEAGKLMYRTTAPYVKPGSDIATLMRTFVTPLVMGGKLTREEAMDNANAVGACLRLLK